MIHRSNYWVFVCILAASGVVGFPLHRWCRQAPSTPRALFESNADDEFMEIPILDLLDESNQETASLAKQIVVPLPSSHLPSNVLATPFVYGMQVDRPLHKLIMEEASSSANSGNQYGHLVWKPSDSTLVGAIGCTAEILINEAATVVFNPDLQKEMDERKMEATGEDNTPKTILCRGGKRFIVKEVVKSIPYPVARVQIYNDDDADEPVENSSSTDDDQDDDDDDDDGDNDNPYADLSTTELVKLTMQRLQAHTSQKLDAARELEISPLEQSILEETGMPVDPATIQQNHAEEMAAVFDVLQSCLIDLEISPQDRPYTVAFMAAEMADVDNDTRREIILTKNPRERLAIVAKKLDETMGMAQAQKMVTTITDKTDEASKDLQVGSPTLPPWANSIRKGSRIEYYWSEQDGWLGGMVAEDPVKVIDELVLTVKFDDGEVHRLPFAPDEKVRWRPGS